MILSLLILSAGILIFLIIGLYLSAPKYDGNRSDHFDGRRFINPGKVRAKGIASVFKWLFTRKRTRWEKLNDDQYGPNPQESVTSGIRITFVNHSTFLIQMN